MSLIQVSNLTFAYNGSYENVFENVSFQLDTDWKLGFIGRNGRGKTTFLKLLCGEYEYQGNITAAVRFDYFPFEVADSAESAVEIVSKAAPVFCCGSLYGSFLFWKQRRKFYTALLNRFHRESKQKSCLRHCFCVKTVFC